MQRKSKWVMWCVLFVAAVCLFGPSVVTYGAAGSSNDSTVDGGDGSTVERHDASGQAEESNCENDDEAGCGVWI
jgi:hypothetical protein